PKRVKIPMCPWHREGYTFQARPRRVGVSSVRATSGHVEGVAGLLLAGVAAGLVARADAAGGEAVVLGQAAPPALADRHEGASAGVDPDSGHGRLLEDRDEVRVAAGDLGGDEGGDERVDRGEGVPAGQGQGVAAVLLDGELERAAQERG